MRARFVGGTEDGKSRWLEDETPRTYLVPIKPTTGSIEDFLNLDYVPEYKVQVYRRGKIDHEKYEVTYTLEKIE